MKLIAENKAVKRLKNVKDAYARTIRENYEARAKSCLTCNTPGACCLDAHFVNVHITRLEAVAIRDVLDRQPDDKRAEIYERVERSIEEYALTAEGDTFAKSYSCPLFEPGTGCLVHNEGKPLPCIHHACYENGEDLPPDELLTEQELLVENLNRRTYGGTGCWLPLPIAVLQAMRR